MSLRLAARIAARDLRGGIAGFRIFLACLTLGVAAIAGVGMVRSAIEAGLQDQGAVILGGDAQAEFTYRFASPEERAWLESISTDLSEIVEFRSMAVTQDSRVLTEVKAVDDKWPLLGTAEVAGTNLQQALNGADGTPGAVMEQVLADQMGITPGDRFSLGTQEFILGGILTREPDSASAGFAMAPRTLVHTADLANSGLITPGTLYDTEYRLTLPPGTDLEALRTKAETEYRDDGLRWQDRTRAAPGVERFVERLGSFLILVGLAGMAVGGVGVASAVRAWIEGRISTIATLRSLGADGRLVFRIHMLQVAALAGLGVALGLVLGVGVPILLQGPIMAALPFPAQIAPYPRPIFEAAFYGLTSAFLFALWPLARAETVRATALYRGGLAGGWPRGRHVVALILLATALVGTAAVTSAEANLTLAAAAGVAGALAVLALAAMGLAALSRRVARNGVLHGRPGLRLALASLGGPRAGTVQVVLGLGLGLTVLAAVGQIDANLRSAIARDLPDRAPSFFFIDIQPDQITPFTAMIDANPAVSRMETAPMLRGNLTRINGQDAREIAGNHWVVRGDRGLSYADAMPEGTSLTEGAWWPEGYSDAPQVSFSAEEAEEIGLKLGDALTVNVLGRDIEATITSLRSVDFSSAGMGFVMVMNAAALQGAPHSHIATVYAEDTAEAAILRQTATAFPNVTAIGIKSVVARVSEAMEAIARATTMAALATLATGFVVLVGAAAAGERQRVYEAAILKTLGASRAAILASFALRAALSGAAAGTVAIVAGALAGWAVMVFVMDSSYAFQTTSALTIIAGGIGATLLASLIFLLRPLAARPASVLRATE